MCRKALLLREESAISSTPTDSKLREQGSVLMPKYDDRGLIAAVAQNSATGEVLMLAFMNEAALGKTMETGFAHFYSRSRDTLWKKGETSGHVLKVSELLIDCDQDAIVMKVEPAGPACHTDARSCFYRKLEGDKLARINGM